LKLGYGVGGVASVLIAEEVGSIGALPFAGVAADRVPRLKAMLVSDVARCLLVVGLANLQHLRSLVLLVVLSACLGTASSFFATSYGAVVPELVEDARQLPTANAVTTISQQVGTVLGPGLAGVVLAISAIYSVLWVDAATYLASIGTLAVAVLATRPAREGASPDPEPGGEDGAEEATSWLEDARVGLRFVWSTNWLRGIITMDALLIAMTMAPVVVLTPYIVVSRFGSDQLLGVIFAGEGVGAVVGGAIASVRRFNRHGGLALVALVPVAVLCFVLAVRAPIGVIVLFFAVVGAGQAFFGVVWMSTVQSRVPEDRLGRVMSVDWALSTSLLPLGMALTALLSVAVGIDPLLAAAGAIGLFVLAATIAQPTLRQFTAATPALVPAAGEEADELTS